MGFCNCSMVCGALLLSNLVLQSSWWGRERAGCFALFVLLVPRDCCVVLPHGATALSVVCDCGIS